MTPRLRPLRINERTPTPRLRRTQPFAPTLKKQLKPGDVKTYADKKDITALMEEQNENARLIEKAKTVRQARQQRIEQLEAIPGRIKEAEETRKSNIKAIDDKLAAEEKKLPG